MFQRAFANRRFLKLAFGLLGGLGLSTSFAQNLPANPDPQPVSYFWIQEPQLPSQIPNSRDMMEQGLDAVSRGFQRLQNDLNLLNWSHVRQPMPMPPDRYVRKFHFGGWIVDPRSQNCLNTRGKVLVRDSQSRVGLAPNNPCYVERGLWPDPYTGKTHQLAANIQIDHVVALKNAYTTGAWRWPWKLRCAYSNFMGNNFHLLSVDGPENLTKSDKAPDRYLPTNVAYRCQYLTLWLKIKSIWRLTLPDTEAVGIANALRAHNCPTSLYQWTRSELVEQRRKMQEAMDACPANPPPYEPPAPNRPPTPDEVF